MDTENTNEETQTAVKQPDELSIFNAVVSAMNMLNEQGRLRLFRTIASFYDIPLGSNNGRSADSPNANSEGAEKSLAQFSEDRAASPKQFLFEKKPHTDGERIACLAYYLTHYRDTPHFKTLDLSKLNTEAAQIKLSNPTAAVDIYKRPLRYRS